MSTSPPHLSPDRKQLTSFVECLFTHASANNYVSLRSFWDGDTEKPFRITAIQLGGSGLSVLIDAAVEGAGQAAIADKPVVFCPPLASFNNRSRAREQDLAEAFAISVECDAKPAAARASLEDLLGPATVVVASGGLWTDPQTGEIEAKLHLHWRLIKPASGSDLPRLKEARRLAAAIVGADPSNVPAVHPIRWPGSWHRKAEPRMCHILDLRPAVEFDLVEALGQLRLAAPKVRPGPKEKPGGDDRRTAELIQQVISGSSYHPSLVPLAARLLGQGMYPGATVNLLYGLMDAMPPERRDARWFFRRTDIPRLVSTAGAKWGANEQGPPVDPVDLWAKFDPPALPQGLLPSSIERFALVQGEMMGADPSGLATAALTVCAAAIPDGIKLKVKRHDPSWTESARLWVALIGTPSTKKSPILSAAMRPLAKLDAELFRKYVTTKAEFDALTPDQRKAGSPPKQTRLRLEDTTIEAAQEVLQDSPDGVLLIQDELSGWFGSMDKYSGPRGGAKDRGFWLQSFNGGAYAINRIGRGIGFIENLSVSMLGGIQPDPIRRLAAEAVDDGLLQRLFPIVLRPASLGQDEPAPPVVQEFALLIERLHRRRAPDLLQFDDGAQRIRRELEEKHLALMSCEAVNRKLAAHIGKYDGLFARLCVVFHCVRHAFDLTLPPIVDEQTASRAAAFLHRFLLPHAVAFYAGVLGLSDDHERLTAVAGYILAHRLERITNRDIQRGDRTMRGLGRNDVAAIFVQLDAFGWIERVPGSRASDPPHWIVNPECHRKFSERARQEAERRQRDREVIARMTLQVAED